MPDRINGQVRRSVLCVRKVWCYCPQTQPSPGIYHSTPIPVWVSSSLFNFLWSVTIVICKRDTLLEHSRRVPLWEVPRAVIRPSHSVRKYCRASRVCISDTSRAYPPSHPPRLPVVKSNFHLSLLPYSVESTQQVNKSRVLALCKVMIPQEDSHSLF